MFITLTNASPAHKGKTVVLNSEHIVSISRVDIARSADEDGTVTSTENVTCIFVPPHGTWEVEESVEAVSELLNR
jgi:hypothetical protein